MERPFDINGQQKHVVRRNESCTRTSMAETTISDSGISRPQQQVKLLLPFLFMTVSEVEWWVVEAKHFSTPINIVTTRHCHFFLVVFSFLYDDSKRRGRATDTGKTMLFPVHLFLTHSLTSLFDRAHHYHQIVRPKERI